MLIPQAIVQAPGAIVATYTPQLTGAGGNPTLGAGSEQYGYYTQIGQVVWFWVRIQVGGAGFVNGSGNVLISLPVTSATAFGATLMPVGAADYYDQSGNDSYVLTGLTNTATTVRFRVDSTTAPDLTFAAPVTWAANDEIYLAGSYPTP